MNEKKANYHFSLTEKELLHIAEFCSDFEGTCFFYSGGNIDSSNYSFLCLFPIEKIEFCADDFSDPWEALKAKLGSFNSNSAMPKWAGYLGYEMGCFSDEEIKISHQKSVTPDVLFYRHSIILKWNRFTKVAEVYIETQCPLLGSFQSKWFHILNSFEGWLQILKNPLHKKVLSLQNFEFLSRKNAFFEKVKEIKNAIKRGDIYQLNLSHEFMVKINLENPFRIFLSLLEMNPTPFMAFLHCGAFFVLSSSPEQFLERKGEFLETRPIKGTIARGNTPQKDQIQCKQLLNSAKEKAELLMITDLMRNDLGKVCLPGSIETSALWKCESYSNVFHLLSIIRGKAQSSLNPIDLIRPLFPGGSITGCPKLEAMKMIHHLESKARGIYTGSIGFICDNGSFCFNIAIRTIVAQISSQSLDLSFRLGSGIVFDSDPECEFEETICKGQTIFKALEIHEKVIGNTWE